VLHDGLTIKRSWVQLPAFPLSCNDPGEVVHTNVPPSPSSIIWYLVKQQWCSVAGKVNVGLVEINGSLLLGLWLKPGFHYPSWRPKLTARLDGWPVSITRQHGRTFPLAELTGRVSTRAVNSGNGNRALVTYKMTAWDRDQLRLNIQKQK